MMYAARKPESLLIYLKRRKMPHAAGVVKDVVRIHRGIESKGL